MWRQNESLNYVAGYCVCNDVSEREFQIERGGQWMKGKGCPTFGPLGPWLVTADEVGDVQNLSMWLDVNGKRMQTGSTKTMIFDVRPARLLHLALHDSGARRRHHHRHAPGRRPRHEAAAVPEGRRRRQPRHREARRAAPEGRRLRRRARPRSTPAARRRSSPLPLAGEVDSARAEPGEGTARPTLPSPQPSPASGRGSHNPSISFAFCTAAPDAPLPRLSRRATRSAWPCASFAKT